MPDRRNHLEPLRHGARKLRGHLPQKHLVPLLRGRGRAQEAVLPDEAVVLRPDAEAVRYWRDVHQNLLYHQWRD